MTYRSLTDYKSLNIEVSLYLTRQKHIRSIATFLALVKFRKSCEVFCFSQVVKFKILTVPVHLGNVKRE